MHKAHLSMFGCVGRGKYTVGHVRRKTIRRVIEHVETMEETHRTNTCDMSKLAVIGNREGKCIKACQCL